MGYNNLKQNYHTDITALQCVILKYLGKKTSFFPLKTIYFLCKVMGGFQHFLGGSLYHRNSMMENISGFEARTFSYCGKP